MSLNSRKRIRKGHNGRKKAKLFAKIARPFLKDFLAEIDTALKKSDDNLYAFELLNVDKLSKQQSDLVNLFESSIRVLSNFYGKETVDEFQGKESKVDVIIDKEEVMKELPDFLLNSKDAFQCQNKKKTGCC